VTGGASSPFIILVAAVAEDGTIGRGGGLPWRLPLDQARFKELTLGHAVLMGRKTWESLPRRPLPGRRNVVLSRNGAFAAPGARSTRSLEEALAACGGDRVFVIGGAEVFAETIGRAHRLVLTRVPGRYGGEARFPPIPANFCRISREEVEGPEPFAVEVWEPSGA
jgi:dihydrofolate reductase